METIFKKNKIDYVVHLAAQTGVRCYRKNPGAYINSNVIDFSNIIKLAKIYKIKNLYLK